MSEESVDIVTETDQLTGKTTTLREAHTGVMPHRVSAVLIFRPNGKLIAQLHKHHGRLIDHSVGGHVSAGEDYETAAKREMQEELGLYLPLTRIARGVLSQEYYPKTGDKNTHIFGVFTAKVDAGWKLTETEEVDKIVEMSVDELVNKMNAEPDAFLQGFLTTMAVYLTHIGSKQKIHAYDKEWGKR